MMEDWDPFGDGFEYDGNRAFPDDDLGRCEAAYYAVTKATFNEPALVTISVANFRLIDVLRTQPLRVIRVASSLIAAGCTQEEVLRQLRLLPHGTPIERMCAAAAIIAQDTDDEGTEEGS